jgi:predicted cupin superfamily sugar epimerase
MDAKDLIRLLKLEPLQPEGGYFAETYRSDLELPGLALSAGSAGGRPLATAIYYLLTPDSFSALHRLPSDEIYHFYLGDPVQMLLLHPNGKSQAIWLGHGIDAGMRVQVVVPGGTWQGSRLMRGGRFALLGTTMAPGFQPGDYDPGDRAALSEAYPDRRDLIAALTRP